MSATGLSATVGTPTRARTISELERLGEAIDLCQKELDGLQMSLGAVMIPDQAPDPTETMPEDRAPTSPLNERLQAFSSLVFEIARRLAKTNDRLAL